MEKIARICWNTHDWRRPSGSEGKSLSDGSYEKKIGFGHEEWILDDSRIYEPNGYHYGFLQPMNVASGKHIGAVYDIHLFSISPLKQKVYVGCLHHAVGVSPEESKMVYQYYKERGAGETFTFEDFVKNDKRDAGVVESRAFGMNGDERIAGTYQHAPVFHKGSPLKMQKVRRRK